MFRTIVCLIVLLLSGLSPSPAQAADSLPDSGLTFTEYDIVENVVYGHKDGMAMTLDVLTPRENAKGIGVILVASGSWKSGKSNLNEENIRKRNEDHWAQGLLQGGFTLFVVRHGSSPRYRVPEMVTDMNRAVRFVRSIAADYGTDPGRLGITSGSSGGHLSLMAAMTGDDGHAESSDPVERLSSRVQCVVAWFPPTDMVNWGADGGYRMVQLIKPELFQRMFGEITDLEQQLKEISPLYFATAESPPLLLIHGDSDRTVPLQQSQLLKTRYESLQRPVKLIVEPGGGHSYWPGIIDEYRETWQWFDHHLAR